jgi:hypothetical protein
MSVFMVSAQKIKESTGLSERLFCKRADLSRMTFRAIKEKNRQVTLKSLSALEVQTGSTLFVGLGLKDGRSDCSTVATAYKTERDGFESWKIHFMDMVDEFRKSLDPKLILLPPPKVLSKKLQALMASMVLELCWEADFEAPPWAKESDPLKEPWFVSETEALKASALVESSVFFKKNNIFVLENFLRRA